MPVCCDVLWVITGFSFVCRDKNGFKDNSGHCVCAALFLLCSLRFLFCASPLGYVSSVFVSSVFFLFNLLGFWVNCSVFLGFSSPLLCVFLLPFIETQTIAPSQCCLCRTVIFHERDYRREKWSMIGSNPLQIFSLWNQDGEDEHDCSISNGDVLAATDSTSNGAVFKQPWTFSIWPLNFGNFVIGPLSK